MGGVAPFLWVDEKTVTLAFLYLGCCGIFWLIGSKTNLKYPEQGQGQDCLERWSARLHSAFGVSLLGRWELPSDRCVPALPALSAYPVLEAGIFLELVLISFLACAVYCSWTFWLLYISQWSCAYNLKRFCYLCSDSYASFSFSVFPCSDSSVAAAWGWAHAYSSDDLAISRCCWEEALFFLSALRCVHTRLPPFPLPFALELAPIQLDSIHLFQPH